MSRGNVGRGKSGGPKGPNVGRPSPTVSTAPPQRATTVSKSFTTAKSQLAAKLSVPPEQRAQKVNLMYDKQFGGHGSGRHGAGTTTAQHEQRVLTGALPEGGTGAYAPRSSSHWSSQQTQLAARHQAQSEFRQNEFTGTAQPAQPNSNLEFTPTIPGTTGVQSTRQGSQKNPTGVTSTDVSGAKVILKPGGGYLTDYPE